ncbi:1212_t:CDS:1, partial [Gigaspora margarita]
TRTRDNRKTKNNQKMLTDNKAMLSNKDMTEISQEYSDLELIDKVAIKGYGPQPVHYTQTD